MCSRKSLKTIMFICPYPQNVAPSQRLKYEQYFTEFEKQGWTIVIRPFISMPFWKVIYKKGYFFQKGFYSLQGYVKRIGDLITATKVDIVYIHLWATPFGPALFERLFRLVSKKIVYDIDDLVYLKNVKSKAHPLVNLIKGRAKPLFLMKAADHVITCTPYLDEFVRKYNQHTTDISSTVDTDRYQPINRYTNQNKVVIGWSGSLTTSRFFMGLQNVLKIIAAKYSIEVFIMGDPSIVIEGVPLTAVAWTEKEELINLQKIDIGVYPLPDEEWVYGKSGLKAIQYMALGIPTVATAIGANFRVIENGKSGFLVKTEQEWVDVLSKLIENVTLRKEVGMNGRQRVEELFSIKANKEKYLKVLNEV